MHETAAHPCPNCHSHDTVPGSTPGAPRFCRGCTTGFPTV